MKYFLIALLLFVGLYASGHKRRYRGEPRTEVGLMNNVLGCLVNKDSVSYFYLFPPFDSLWALVLHPPDHSPEAQKELEHLKEHPKALLQFDPMYNHAIMGRFLSILTKGEDSGIHWSSTVMQRYELSREVPTSRDLTGYSRIVPERFKGYMFVRDVLGRITFCISITEIQKINGYFFGGQVLNILEASTVDQYLKKEDDENKYFAWLAKNKLSDTASNDSAKNSLADSLAKAADTSAEAKKLNFLSISPSDDDTLKARREVVERKYYEGLFDEEIPVKLYVRYMKDLRTGKISAYDGLYKFGDQVSYVKLNITRTADGKWSMEDDPPVGSMDLVLKDKIYTGSWTNNANQTGYDVELKPHDISQRKMEQLENILDKGLSGRVDEPNAPQKKDKASADDDKADDDKPSKDNEKDKPEKEPKVKKKVNPKNDDD